MPKLSSYPYGSINPPRDQSIVYASSSVEEVMRGMEEGDPLLYGRWDHANTSPLKEWLAELEGTTKNAVWLTNSGMAAIDLLFRAIRSSKFRSRERIVASPYLYGGTWKLLKYMQREGLSIISWVKNTFEIESWEKVMCERSLSPALVFLESPSNPTAELFDIRGIAEIVHRHGSRLVVDNTIGVGLVSPLQLGADGVLYSVSKAINRKSSHLGGALVLTPEYRDVLGESLDELFKLVGYIMSSESACAAMSGRTTLKDDMRKFSHNATRLAHALLSHEAVQRVCYPSLPSSSHHLLAKRQMPEGAGGLLSFDLGSFEKAVRFVEEQEAAYLAVHLGDVNNDFVTLPITASHSDLSEAELLDIGITPGLVRVSVSLKDTVAFSAVIAEYMRVLDTLV